MSEHTGDQRLPIEGGRAYLHCPRRFQFAHIDDLDPDERVQDDRLGLLRRALCEALRHGSSLAARARSSLAKDWTEQQLGLHSTAQRAHERRRLEAVVGAYVEAVGGAHAEALSATRAGGVKGELVGPDLPLEATFESVTITAPVDYAFRSGSTLTGVRFLASPATLGSLRYDDEWDGQVARRFTEHTDQDSDQTHPEFVGHLLETAAVLEGLRALRDHLELESVRTCRYVVIPLLDRSATTVDWMSETVETTVEPVDLTDRYIDHHTFARTHEHRNRAVDRYLRAIVADAVDGPYDPRTSPSTDWAHIEAEACPECPFAICCGDRLESEVGIDD